MTATLEHKSIKIGRLIEQYRAGQIVIPEFQRDYVWKANRAPKLIDSLYRSYPVSSLLLWQSDEPTRARRSNPRPSNASLISWLIDGQQRVITLARTLSGDEGIEVVFNAETEEFRLSNWATQRDPNWHRIADLWDDEIYRHLRRNLDGSPRANRHEQRFEKVRRILDYDVPYVRMVDYSFHDAVEAFKRTNTLGVKLKREDIESAEVAAKHTGFIADKLMPFLESLKRRGFGRLNIMHLFRACAFVAIPDGRTRTPLHELPSSTMLQAWKKTEQACIDAIGLIRSELGLVNMEVLWSGAFVVPAIALCASLPPRQRNPRAVAGWIALAALWHRYSRSSDTALDQDLRACRESDPIRALLSNLRSYWRSLKADPSDFDGAIADRSGLLALYVACLQRGILDFYTGQRILLQDSIDRHHILPRAQFPEKERARADCIANIAFIFGGVNKSISTTGPEVYLEQLGAKVRKSQCIPEDRSLWRIDRANEFWDARKVLLAEAFNEFVKSALPQRRL